MDHKKIVQFVNLALKNKDSITLKSLKGAMSMVPLIIDDTELYVEKVDKIKIGDLLLMDFYTELCCHRVISKRNGIYTKGDYNEVVDYKVENHQILGRVYGIKRAGKFYNFKQKNFRIYSFLIAVTSRMSATRVKQKCIRKIGSTIRKIIIGRVIAKGQYEKI